MDRNSLIWICGVVMLTLAAFFIEEQLGLLGEGTRAPDFTATLGNGTRISLSDYFGKKNVVLFFYPRDFTAGCTAQVCSIRNGYGELSKLDAEVFGVSDDSSNSHSLFRARYNLPFELVADVNRSLIKAFGADRLRGLVRSTRRVTYVIDKRGIIRLVAHHEFMMGRHLEDVLRVLGSLQQ